MIPVHQTIINTVNGNCWAAVWASLLELSISDVPNFVEAEDDMAALETFLKPKGYSYAGYLVNPNRKLPEALKSQYEHFRQELPVFGHLDGYYEATVFSSYMDPHRYETDPDYEPPCHAVIVDRYFNIVHDPNPLAKYCGRYPFAEQLGYNGVIGVCLWSQEAKQKSPARKGKA